MKLVTCLLGVCLLVFPSLTDAREYQGTTHVPMFVAYICGPGHQACTGNDVYGNGAVSNFQHQWFQIINDSNMTFESGIDTIRLYLYAEDGSTIDPGNCPAGLIQSDRDGAYIDVLNQYGHDNGSGRKVLPPNQSIYFYTNLCLGDEPDDVLPIFAKLVFKTRDLPLNPIVKFVIHSGWEMHVKYLNRSDMANAATILDKEIVSLK